MSQDSSRVGAFPESLVLFSQLHDFRGSTSSHTLHIQTTMTGPVQNTVDRLDRPSAYYLGRVCTPHACSAMDAQFRLTIDGLQNKKRKFHRDREDKDERERTPEEQEDPLKDATTLYVGNLYVTGILHRMTTRVTRAHYSQVILHDRRADPRVVCKVSPQCLLHGQSLN